MWNNRGQRTSRDPVARTLRVTMPAIVFLVSWLLVACSSSGASASTRATQAPSSSRGVSPTPDTSLTYVAIGASDAFGIGTEHPATQSWPTDLAAQLGSHIHLINLGIPGATIAQAQREELPIALAAHPDIVTVFLGVNDVEARVPLNTFTRELRTLVNALVHETHAAVYVGNLPDLSLLPYFAHYNAQELHSEVQARNQAIADICQSQGATLVNIYADWGELSRHPEYISSDGLHPSALGAEGLAAVFAAAIQTDAAPRHNGTKLP